jgi:hypothetical protein
MSFTIRKLIEKEEVLQSYDNLWVLIKVKDNITKTNSVELSTAREATTCAASR